MLEMFNACILFITIHASRRMFIVMDAGAVAEAVE
jgi:hypothetical protein